MQKRIRIGVDVGGTFTDFVLVDEHRDMIFTGKQLTTPTDPGKAICEGVARIALEAGVEMSQLDGIVHGTTLVTNAVIERLGAKVGLITTGGFRDVLEVGHEMRYDLYDLFLEKPEPLVPRNLRLTVNERISSDGEILVELDEAGLKAASDELVAEGVDAIAVCFINARKTGDRPRLNDWVCRGLDFSKEPWSVPVFPMEADAVVALRPHSFSGYHLAQL